MVDQITALVNKNQLFFQYFQQHLLLWRILQHIQESMSIFYINFLLFKDYNSEKVYYSVFAVLTRVLNFLKRFSLQHLTFL